MARVAKNESWNEIFPIKCGENIVKNRAVKSNKYKLGVFLKKSLLIKKISRKKKALSADAWNPEKMRINPAPGNANMLAIICLGKPKVGKSTYLKIF